ncbi:MAG TPA: hypothetical protein VI076_14840 [Actinopolymorphaceae bacterium]
MARVTASAVATALVFAAGQRWHPTGPSVASPAAVLAVGAAALVVITAVAVRAWTGSRIAVLVAEVAFPLAALALVLTAGLG